MHAAVAPIPFSFTVLLTLLLALALSCGIYWALVWRETSRRQWVALADWARDAGFRFRRDALLALPPPLSALPEPTPRVELCIGDARTTLAQFRAAVVHANAAVHAQSAAAASTEAGGATPAPVVTPAPPAEGEATWHVLLRRLDVAWPPTGLRPAHADTSALDLFSLSSFPRLGNIERFVVYGTDSDAAAALSRSSARALLPPDVGLLLHGHHLLLDFSARPFDATEFNRMLAVADQVVAHLPVG